MTISSGILSRLKTEKATNVLVYLLSGAWALIVSLTLIGSFYKIPTFVLIGFYSQDILRLCVVSFFALSPIFFLLGKGRVERLNIKAIVAIAALFAVIAFGLDVEAIVPYNKEITFFEEPQSLTVLGEATCWDDRKESYCEGYSAPFEFKIGQKFKVGTVAYRIDNLSLEKRVVQTAGALWRTQIVDVGCNMFAVDVADQTKRATAGRHDVMLSSKNCF